MSKGTILYVGGFELPDKNAAAHRVLSNGKILRELGYNVVFIGVDKTLKSNVDILETMKRVQGFESWSLPYPKSNKEWFRYLTNINSIVMIINQYDEVKALITYNYQAIVLYRLRNYCYKYNIKIIADCTEWYSLKRSNIVFSIIKGFDSFLRMRVIQKHLDGLIVISKYLENYYRHCRNIVRIPPLVDLNEEKWDIVPSKVNNDKIRFVYSGNPGKYKDKINLLVEELFNLKDYNDYVFNVVGITKEQYTYYYPDHKEILIILGERINFIGRISHLESLKYLKNSDFSIFIRENTRLTKAGFPTKFVESVSCGIPVITTNTSDLNGYLTEAENGFFIDCNNWNIEKVFMMKRDEIYSMKSKCKCKLGKTFDYKNYISKVRNFMGSVESR